VPIHSIAIADCLLILRTFQNEFPNVTWYTGGSYTLLPATPETVTKAQLEELFQVTTDDTVVKEDLGRPEQISRHLILEFDQFREFAGGGAIVKDDSAFFLPINAEMPELIRIVQMATIRTNP